MLTSETFNPSEYLALTQQQATLVQLVKGKEVYLTFVFVLTRGRI